MTREQRIRRGTALIRGVVLDMSEKPRDKQDTDAALELVKIVNQLEAIIFGLEYKTERPLTGVGPGLVKDPTCVLCDSGEPHEC